MFNEISIVSTAINSFNNAALVAPYFLAIALLTLPLFLIVYLYGRDIMGKINLTGRDIDTKTGFWSIGIFALWLLIFGGNYAVIRDGISLLNIMIAFVLFVSVVFISNRLVAFNYVSKLKNKKVKFFVSLSLVLLAVFSAYPNLYGILLQLSALFCGMIIGSRMKTKLSDAFYVPCILCFASILMLMQPEYFRFGQLGNLTIIHLCGILITGFFAITALVTRYVHPRARIYNSAYVKLKWLMRILGLLVLVLFGLTESVPVFLGLIAVVGLMEILSVWHAKELPDNDIWKKSLAMTLICFGTISVLPIITCFGILYLVNSGKKISFGDFKFLL